MSDHYNYAVIYTDGGARENEMRQGAGWGVHGYFFNALPSVRFAKVPVIITPEGYKEKPTGDQLKDATHDVKYSKWDYSITLKGAGVIKDSKDVLLVDGWCGEVGITAQRAELLAFIAVFDSLPHSADKYCVLADSQYLIKGFNSGLEKWVANKWHLADGEDVKHKDLWERILAIKTEYGDRIDLSYIKAHVGHYGNECADRNATFGVIQAINSVVELKPEWVDTYVNDEDYWEMSKPVPSILRTKWVYSFTNEPDKLTEVAGVPHKHYFVGDHNKTADDVELLGMRLGDAGFGLVLLNGDVPILNRIKEFHEKHMWETTNTMYQSQVINMINIGNVMAPKILWEERYAGAKAMWLKSHRNDLISRTDALVSKVLRPPKLSYRIADEEQILEEVLFAYLNMTGTPVTTPKSHAVCNLTINPVTDLFYETTLKKDGSLGQTKMTNFYDQVAKAVTVELKNPCVDKPVKVVLTRGIDLPTRNMMAGLCDDHPRVNIVTWKFSKMAFRYAVIIQTDNAHSVWCGNYRNTRYLDGQPTA